MTSLNSFLYPVEVKKVGTKRKVMWRGDFHRLGLPPDSVY